MKLSWRHLLSLPDSGETSPALFFAELPTLETPRLILRQPRMRDAEDVFAYASDPEVAKYVLWDPHRSKAETRLFLRDLISRRRRGYPSSWVITLRDTGRVIGTVGFVWYSLEHRSAEMGYSLSRKYWNKGYATEALAAVTRKAFDCLPLNRLEAQHDLRNPASGRVMEKCGFRREGILRSRMMNKGEAIDVALYAILRKEILPDASHSQ